MLRILIVDDDPEKTRRIARVAVSVPGVHADGLETAVTLHAARGALRQSTYDLVILDLFVPEHLDNEPDPNGGVRLLQELRDRPNRYRMPGHVIGVTQHRELRDDAAAVFAQSALTVLLYDRTSDEWESTLIAALQHILAAQESKSANDGEFQSGLAVVCALPLELDAVKRLDWHWDEQVRRYAGDPTAYHCGWYDQAGERQMVYAAVAPRMGMPAASVLATKMIQRFVPNMIAMPGIAAGVRGAVELGDVIVADPSWDYGSGKWVDREGDSQFRNAPHQLGLSPPLRTALSLMAEDRVALARIQDEWSGEPVATRLRVHVGPVASGAAVIADRDHVEHILAQHRKTLGVEMEAYGVYVAAQEARIPPCEVVAIKGVVDFADPAKGDSLQRYGAYVSTAVLKHLVEKLR